MPARSKATSLASPHLAGTPARRVRPARTVSADICCRASRLPGWGGGLELRNVAANYPFERSHRFAGIQPNYAHGDYSRLSCVLGEMPLGPRAAGIFSKTE